MPRFHVLCMTALASLLWLACKSAPSPVSPESLVSGDGPQVSEPVRITLVGTNDFHGWLEPRMSELADGRRVGQGGIATFAGYVKILRENNPGGVLLLDAGDLFQGTLAANVTEGAAVIDAFNRLGFDAAAIGNHEFDYGPVGPEAMAKRPEDDPFGALKARIAQAKFPLLSVNIYNRDGKRPAWLPGDGTVLLDVKGVRIGVFGLTTPQTPYTTNPANVASLRFGALLEETQSAAKSLRERGADLVVGLAHAGGRCWVWRDPNDVSSCDRSHGEVFRLLEQLAPGTLDALIAGHTHQVLGHFVNGTPVIETTGMGRSFGRIELFIDPKSKRLLSELTVIEAAVPVCAQVNEKGSCDPDDLEESPAASLQPAQYQGREVLSDVGMQSLLEPALERVRQMQEKRLGVQVPKMLKRKYEAESGIGSAFADALREMEKADVALMNSGGFRADLPAGELTYGRLYEVLPFDNTVATLFVSGEELQTLLEAAYSARKGVFQVSGLMVELGQCTGTRRLKSVRFSNGRAISPSRKYKVVLPDFLARGGDGLGAVISRLDAKQVDLGERRPANFRDAMANHFVARKKPLVAPKSGRIVFQKTEESCAPGTSQKSPQLPSFRASARPDVRVIR
ncbi:MAG: bifunctional metallophosphatase/5'-nucleotidase [Myxococcaceae bacterium]